MNTIETDITSGTIEQFASEHGLTMEIGERPLPADSPSRYYAAFRKCEVMERGLLISEFGNGSTKAEAIAAYARRISMRRIVIDAYSKQRREISVWRLVESPVDSRE
jgi:hypothetical protein